MERSSKLRQYFGLLLFHIFSTLVRPLDLNSDSLVMSLTGQKDEGCTVSVCTSSPSKKICESNYPYSKYIPYLVSPHSDRRLSPGHALTSAVILRVEILVADCCDHLGNNAQR